MKEVKKKAMGTSRRRAFKIERSIDNKDPEIGTCLVDLWNEGKRIVNLIRGLARTK